MKTVRIYRLNNIPQSVQARIREAQMEAARVWNDCCQIHLKARQNRSKWPNRDDLQKATKGRYALHSQMIQIICHAFLANVDATRQLKKNNPKMRYPYKEKRFYPLCWPEQAVSIESGRVVLPMGRGRQSIVLKVDLPPNAGACKIVWNNGYELHVAVPVEIEETIGEAKATVDLGQIHQAAVVTNTGHALVVSGRGIRSIKRYRNKELGKLTKMQARCQKGSRRWRKLQKAKNELKAKTGRQVRDLRHKGTRKVIDFCKEQGVTTLYIGNPDGVRTNRCGRKHNQRMSQWEYGKDILYLSHKAKAAGIECFTGTERGTSSRCPECGHHQKPKSRTWQCRNCGFIGHRDVVGATNMHPIAYGEKIEFPYKITYLRPGKTRNVVVTPTRAKVV